MCLTLWRKTIESNRWYLYHFATISYTNFSLFETPMIDFRIRNVIQTLEFCRFCVLECSKDGLFAMSRSSPARLIFCRLLCSDRRPKYSSFSPCYQFFCNFLLRTYDIRHHRKLHRSNWTHNFYLWASYRWVCPGVENWGWFLRN